jgi:hypothetical protein
MFVKRERFPERLLADAKLAVETDPQIAVELNNRAMAALGEEAAHEVMRDLMETKRAAIEREEQRQIELNRLDVKLALTGELDLADKELVGLLEHGDKLKLFYEDAYGIKGDFTLCWHVADADSHWWRLDSSSKTLLKVSDNLYQKHALDINKSMFVWIAAIDTDMQTGEDKWVRNKLKIGLPIGMEQGKHFNKVGTESEKYNDANSQIILTGSDFQTKDIRFFSTPTETAKQSEDSKDPYVISISKSKG